MIGLAPKRHRSTKNFIIPYLKGKVKNKQSQCQGVRVPKLVMKGKLKRHRVSKNEESQCQHRIKGKITSIGCNEIPIYIKDMAKNQRNQNRMINTYFAFFFLLVTDLRIGIVSEVNRKKIDSRVTPKERFCKYAQRKTKNYRGCNRLKSGRLQQSSQVLTQYRHI